VLKQKGCFSLCAQGHVCPGALPRSPAPRDRRSLDLVQVFTRWAPPPRCLAAVEPKVGNLDLVGPARDTELDDLALVQPRRDEHVRVVVDGAASPRELVAADVGVDLEPPPAHAIRAAKSLPGDARREAHPKVVPVGRVRRRHLGRPPVPAIGRHPDAVRNDAPARPDRALGPFVDPPHERVHVQCPRVLPGPPGRPHLVVGDGGGGDLHSVARRRMPRLVRGARHGVGGGWKGVGHRRRVRDSGGDQEGHCGGQLAYHAAGRGEGEEGRSATARSTIGGGERERQRWV